MKRLSLAITLIGLLLSCQPISLKEDKENVVAAFPPGTNRALEGTAGSRHDFENGAVASNAKGKTNYHFDGNND